MVTANGATYITKYAHEIPHHFKERFIESGYRPVFSSVWDCFVSIFRKNNETLNVWTHLLGSIFFLLVSVSVYQELGWPTTYTLPLYLFMLAAVVYPFSSALAHMFNVVSWEARDICFFVDYATIAVFGHCASCAYLAFSFPEALQGSSLQKHFMKLSAIAALWSVYASCHTRFMKPSLARQCFRLSGFVISYCFAAIPILIRLYLHSEEDELATPVCLNHWRRQFMFAAIMAFFYLTHFPERLFPGLFDNFGHSHQLFHLAGCATTIDQLRALLCDLDERRSVVTPFFTASELISSVVFVVAGIILIVLHYSHKVYRMGPSCSVVRDERRHS